jgi:hypothetical protein
MHGINRRGRTARMQPRVMRRRPKVSPTTKRGPRGRRGGGGGQGRCRRATGGDACLGARYRRLGARVHQRDGHLRGSGMLCCGARKWVEYCTHARRDGVFWQRPPRWVEERFQLNSQATSRPWCIRHEPCVGIEMQHATTYNMQHTNAYKRSMQYANATCSI